MQGRSKAEKYAAIKKKKKETRLEDLCKDVPEEFKEFMHYCRGLAFTQDPDYGYIINLFQACMKKKSIDPKTPDFLWNKNRLAVEKQSIKEQMLAVINKKQAGAKDK